jgi:pyruvate dehydrogenase E2 component (dihydrolipoamide acetyltransferase)
MSRDVIIPRLGSSDESDEVRVLRWLKEQGDEVHKGEAIVEVETDKVNVEVDDGFAFMNFITLLF